MKKFLVVDQFLGGETMEVDADTHEQAARLTVATPEALKMCISPILVLAEHQEPITGSMSFVDEATREGWGRGCKFDGKYPQHQICCVVIER